MSDRFWPFPFMNFASNCVRIVISQRSGSDLRPREGGGHLLEMGTLQILGLKCTHQDRTCLLTSEFRQQFGSNIGQNLGLQASIMIEHRAHFRAKSVRIVIEHIKAYADLLDMLVQSNAQNGAPKRWHLTSRTVEILVKELGAREGKQDEHSAKSEDSVITRKSRAKEHRQCQNRCRPSVSPKKIELSTKKFKNPEPNDNNGLITNASEKQDSTIPKYIAPHEDSHGRYEDSVASQISKQLQQTAGSSPYSVSKRDHQSHQGPTKGQIGATGTCAIIIETGWAFNASRPQVSERPLPTHSLDLTAIVIPAYVARAGNSGQPSPLPRPDVYAQMERRLAVLIEFKGTSGRIASGRAGGEVRALRTVADADIDTEVVYRAAHDSSPTSHFVRMSAGDRDQRSVVLLGSARWARLEDATRLCCCPPPGSASVCVWCSIVIVDVGQNASFVVRRHAGRSAALVPCAVLRRGGGPCFAFRVIETQCERWLCALASSRIFFFGGAMRGWHGGGWHFASLGDGYAFRRRAGEGAGVEE
ncbi:hypothetical protein B0H13DRAFT_2276379 [Mycena leptocephala]|nr:hypothetical protein B0H13DRAFT_2276379 [Mycena leptocephala]